MCELFPKRRIQVNLKQSRSNFAFSPVDGGRLELSSVLGGTCDAAKRRSNSAIRASAVCNRAANDRVRASFSACDSLERSKPGSSRLQNRVDRYRVNQIFRPPATDAMRVG